MQAKQEIYNKKALTLIALDFESSIRTNEMFHDQWLGTELFDSVKAYIDFKITDKEFFDCLEYENYLSAEMIEIIYNPDDSNKSLDKLRELLYKNNIDDSAREPLTKILIQGYLNEDWIKHIQEKTGVNYLGKHPILGHYFSVFNEEIFFKFIKYTNLALNYYDNFDTKNTFIAKHYRSEDSIINSIERKAIVEIIETGEVKTKNVLTLEWLKRVI